MGCRRRRDGRDRSRGASDVERGESQSERAGAHATPEGGDGLDRTTPLLAGTGRDDVPPSLRASSCVLDGPPLGTPRRRVGAAVADHRVDRDAGAAVEHGAPAARGERRSLRLRPARRGRLAQALAGPLLLTHRPAWSPGDAGLAPRGALHRRLHLHAVHERLSDADLANGHAAAKPGGGRRSLRLLLRGSGARHARRPRRLCRPVDREGDAVGPPRDDRREPGGRQHRISRRGREDPRSEESHPALERLHPGGRRRLRARCLSERRRGRDGAPGCGYPPAVGRFARSRRLRVPLERLLLGSWLRRVPRQPQARAAPGEPSRCAADAPGRVEGDNRCRVSASLLVGAGCGQDLAGPPRTVDRGRATRRLAVSASRRAGSRAGQAQRHCPAEHVSLPRHVAHAMPPAPQALGVCEAYGMQVVPSQQPAGHDVVLQTQVPEEPQV